MKQKPSLQQSKASRQKQTSRTLPMPLLLITVVVTIIAISVFVFRSGDLNAEQTTQPAPTARESGVRMPPPPPPPPPQHNHEQPQNVTPEERRRFVDSLRATFVVEACCASPLETCLRQKPKCAIAPNLNRFLNWMDSIANVNPHITTVRIAEELQKRYISFADNTVYAIDPGDWPVIGDANAPITLGMYFSGTCPTCKSGFRDLHAEVTRGSLKGKVKIVAKPFTSGFANRSITAAHNMGHFSEYMLEIARRGGRVDTTAVYEVAAALRLDLEKFKRLTDDPDVLKRLEEATKEGENNGVRLVPTYFINGRRYESFVSHEWVVDAVNFIYDNEIKKKN